MRKHLNSLPGPLQSHDWPVVEPFSGYDPAFETFLHAEQEEQKAALSGVVRRSWDKAGAFLSQALAGIYAYVYGYPDSPCYLSTDPELEIKLQRAKVQIEEVYLNLWLDAAAVPVFESPEAAFDYLRGYVETNAGVGHELFDYLRDDASAQALKIFLRLEVCRNEVVDDEVALLVCGLQGNLKRMAGANLWDEFGNGRLANFHTYWLRRLLEHTDDWEGLRAFRKTQMPWCASISSNAFNALLTRPGHKYRAYGFFTTTEAWVRPHFQRLLIGLERVGLSHPDTDVYFAAHCSIDPLHAGELLDGIQDQVPPLSLAHLVDIIRGAHLAVAAGENQYRLLLEHLKVIDAGGRP
ncbi:iron-containing redox enzyme family protein [Pseudomonas sp. 18175]|uniref:iron-containing redox enzyme family protein n=1 Tax=Pseudomonas sp. 18175 TaxID=3390056 RepID=UPI003D1B449E